MGGALGVGAASLMSKKPSYSYAFDAHSNMAVEKPATPESPEPVETKDGGAGTTGNAGMEAEREKERQQALLRRNQAQDIFTSGLGAGGLAQTAKKTLLGG